MNKRARFILKYGSPEYLAAANALLDSDHDGIPSETLAHVMEDHLPGARLRRMEVTQPMFGHLADYRVSMWFLVDGEVVRLDGSGDSRAAACAAALTGEGWLGSGVPMPF